jgi:autotransporter-associated beta strand protein
LVAVLVDPALADIDVQAGVLSVEKVITSLGNPARTLSISNGATLQFFQVSNVLSKILLLRDGAIVFNNNGTNTFGGPVTLQGSNTFNAGGTWLRFTNVLGGSGSLVKVGGSPLFLAASNTYSGDTVVIAGMLTLTNSGSIDHSARINLAAGAVLDVSGRIGGSLTLAPGQLLQGNGTINGALAVLSGATISPGASIGALTVTNSIALSGVTAMELNKTLATNDVIRTFAGINYGGTLALTNLAGALGAGDEFRLFVATNYSGAFTNLAPPSPGVGLAWDTSQLAVSGTLRVVAVNAPVINTIALSGTNVVVSGAGGSVGPYYVLTSTNVALPLANWTRAATNIFGPGGTFVFTNAVNPVAAQSFFVLQLP